jgi:nucleoside-diphosphate-sugar epimerase
MTTKLATEALANNCKLIFASSVGAVYLEDEYSIYKRAMEQYIQALVPNHLILRIPRVYGTDKKKGLMRRIQNDDIGKDDWEKLIDYIDISDFKKWFNENLNNIGIQCYTGSMRTNTIQELKELYCEL